jgi:hypothetical protein
MCRSLLPIFLLKLYERQEDYERQIYNRDSGKYGAGIVIGADERAETSADLFFSVATVIGQCELWADN